MESWKRKLRMGMVGGGRGSFIGAVHRIVACMDLHVQLVAGCFSRDFKNTQATCGDLYLEPARCYKSYEEMAEKEAALPAEERIDFVSIVTPNVSHFPIAKKFLECGIHVVLDKPMTFTLAEAKRLVKLVEKTGLVFCLTHNYTGFPLVREARGMFASGKMGDVRRVNVEYLQEFLMFPHEKKGSKQAIWRTDPAQSGIAGTIGDVGTHAFNLMEFVTGQKVVELCCDKSTFLPDRALEEDANILLRLEGGGKGVLCCSQIACGEENHLWLRVYGSEGAIVWDQENPNYMSYYQYGKPRQVYNRGRDEFLSKFAMEGTRLPWGHPEGYLEAFANTYCEVVKAIRACLDGKPMKTADYGFPTVYDGLRGMQFITAAVQSAERGGKWVKVQ
jgi:predicted dehydrogenase